MHSSINQVVIVCIPAYNEANNITEIIKNAKLYCTDVIVCDDGSVDGTAKAALEAGAILVQHSVNKGYGSAIKTLFDMAKKKGADIIITIDSDGQHNPDQIPTIIEPILKNQADIVIGSRFLVKGDQERVPLYRAIGIKTITRLAQMVSYSNITDAQSGFRAYSKKALQSIELTEEGMSVSTEILVKAKEKNLRIKEVPVTIRYDVEDASTHNPLSHGFGVIVSIIKFISVRHPLAFFGIPGLIFLILAGVFAVWTIKLYSSEGFFSINMAVLSVGLGIFGLVLLVSGVVLWLLASEKKSRISTSYDALYP